MRPCRPRAAPAPGRRRPPAGPPAAPPPQGRWSGGGAPGSTPRGARRVGVGLWLVLAACAAALAVACARSAAVRAFARRALPAAWHGAVPAQGPSWVMKEASGQIPGARYEQWPG